MRVVSWHPEVLGELKGVAYARLVEASYVVKDKAVQRLRGHIGSGKTTGISRPVYKTGPYAKQKWTAREFGNLLKSIRVVEKKDWANQTGRIMAEYMNVRIYAGNNMAYYALIFEFNKAFLRPALWESEGKVKSILGIQ